MTWRRAARALLCVLPLIGGCTIVTPEPEAVPAPALSPGEPEPALLLRGGTVLTAAGPRLERADVLIVGSELAAVGSGFASPERATVLDVSGRWVTPGLIDVHSHIGVYPLPQVPPHSDGNETTAPFTPEVRALESFWPQDPAIRYAVAGGVTSLHVLPGSANLVGGQGVTVRLVRGRSASDMRFPGAPTTMKMACGENPKSRSRAERGYPATRMGEVAQLRQRLAEAESYAPEPGEAVDYGKRALGQVIAGEILIQNHCYRADEMLLRLELFQEFGIVPRAFHHAVEAYKIRDVLAQAGVGVATWADRWGFKLEAYDAVPAAVALLDAAGVCVAVKSDSPDDVQRLNQEAAKAMAAGRRIGLAPGRSRAIRWITANPAWIAGVEERTGTLEAGKLADVVVWSGDPFSVYAKADLVFIGGELVYDRSRSGSYPRTDFELGHESLP